MLFRSRVAVAGKIALAGGYQFLDIGPLFGTLLRAGQRVEETFELRQGQQYVFLAGGDDDANDVDLYLYDASGNLVVKDSHRDRSALMQFRAPRTARYRVVLSVDKSGPRGAFCAMSVLTRDRSHSFEMRAESLLDTLVRLEASFLILEKALRENLNQDLHLQFHSGNNTWLLMGAILNHKSSVSSDPKRFPSGEYIGITLGEESCSDANLYINDASGRQLLRGTDTQSFSFVAFNGGSGDPLSLQMENAYSRRPSLLLTAVLRIDR